MWHGPKRTRVKVKHREEERLFKIAQLKAYLWSKLLTSELLFVVSHAEQHRVGRNGLQDRRCN
jgi:hypothetical protein